MLVFQLNWNHIEGTADELNKGCARAGIEPKWLVEVVAEINLYLPDDWRMTRSTNDFRILVASREKNILLVGFSYRTDENKILSVIDSVHLKHFNDNIASSFQIGKKKKTSSSQGKSMRSGAPNLYFFRPAPENDVTPLFARQYERIKKKSDGLLTGDEYHRIHPLTKRGLDLTHFHWVRWTNQGDVKFDTVDPQYHGKDFWDIKILKNEPKRTFLEKYIENFNEICKKYEVKVQRAIEDTPNPYETEYKFLVPGTPSEARKIFNLLEEYIPATGLDTYDKPKSRKKQEDIYFDDDHFSLHAEGISFRVRKKDKDNILVTLKKRLPSTKGYSKKGLYVRIEEEAVITASEEKMLMAGKPINAFPYRVLSYIAPRHGLLRPKLNVINKRKAIILNDKKLRKAELCLDSVFFEFDGKPSFGPYFEIEIESKGLPVNKIVELAHDLQETFGLIPSLQSKYERGISLMKTAAISQEKKKVIIDTDCGVDDALALILALKSPELAVEAITTVSGNVHVDKVIPNVFKVLKALELDDHPCVARGADRPIKRELIKAESVHGKDGLGDVPSPPPETNVDSRPGWQVICDLARAYPKQITLITIGPLTNLALAIQNDPDGVRCLKGIVAMGGVFFNVGNVGPDVEFNVAADPEAAFEVTKFCRDSCIKTPVDKAGKAVVLPLGPKKKDYRKIFEYKDHDPDDQNMVPLTYVGLDVTHKVLLRRSSLERTLKTHPKNKLLKFVRDISAKYMKFYYENEWLPGCYLHDPLAVAYVINPAFLQVEKHIIHVETAGNFTGGVIYPDDRPTKNPAWRNPAEEVINIARHVEREAFEEFFMMRLLDN